MRRFGILAILALIISLCSLGTTIYLISREIVPDIYLQMSFSDTLLLAETIVLTATLVVVGYQIIVQQKELSESSRNRQGTFMFEVFKGLSTDQAEKDREYVYNSLPEPGRALQDPGKDAMNRVWIQLNQLGLFIEKGLIEEDLVMELYWDVIIKCWTKLEGHLKAERDKRKFDMFQKYFEILAERAKKYQKEHYPNQVIEYYKEPRGFFL